MTVSLAVALGSVAAGAQTPGREKQLADGWAAIAAGRPAPAAETAARLLRVSPRDHDAASLAMAATVAASGPFAGLDVYERWLAVSRHEDRFLLEPVAIALLRELSGVPESRIAARALAVLAQRGDAAAKTRLAAMSEALPVEADAELARAGDAQALERLRRRLAAGGSGDRTGIVDALKRSGRGGATAIIAEALRDPAPPTRIAAAHALAELGATEAIPELRGALTDEEPSVRGAVRVALGLLGDPEGQEALASLAESPVGAYRLLLAQREARRDPHGPWARTVEALLEDADPMVRIASAELLLRYNRSARAEAALSAILADPSAPVRTLAARALATTRLTAQTLPVLRRMLRDPLADVRLEAVLALLDAD